MSYVVEAQGDALKVRFLPSRTTQMGDRLLGLFAGVACVGLAILAVSDRGLTTFGWVGLVALGIAALLSLPSMERRRREVITVTKDGISHQRGIWSRVSIPLAGQRFCVLGQPSFWSSGFGAARVGVAGSTSKFGASGRLTDAEAAALVATLNGFLEA